MSFVSKSLLFFSLLLTSLTALGNSNAVPITLSAYDKNIYEYTLARCQSGSAGSAALLGLSANISTLKNSQGFWVALGRCYGYQYGTLNYGNLMKQLIDVGHLTQESATALIFLYSTYAVLASRGMVAAANSPLAARAITASATFLALAQAYIQLWSLLGSDESDQGQASQPNVLNDANAAVEQLKFRAKIRISELENQINDPNLVSADKEQLKIKKRKIEAALQNLETAKN